MCLRCEAPEIRASPRRYHQGELRCFCTSPALEPRAAAFSSSYTGATPTTLICWTSSLNRKTIFTRGLCVCVAKRRRYARCRAGITKESCDFFATPTCYLSPTYCTTSYHLPPPSNFASHLPSILNLSTPTSHLSPATSHLTSHTHYTSSFHLTSHLTRTPHTSQLSLLL